MEEPRFDGIYYFQKDDHYFCYQFKEAGVISFIVKQLTPEAIAQAARFPARGSCVHRGGRRYQLGFSRDTDIYATVKADDKLEVVISTDYGDKLNERRIYTFMPLEP